ncbi:MAG: ABC transporter permease subunit/CPBP intramembrane protease [Planctomycetota bacterium]|nr:ABC transporter permease subunit/CPBP intramembrane protease [Planctomycetota bacterium]
MQWKNVRLIFRREMRDQLRDRRTLFMIAVLPILFYPLLGVSFFQIAQFLREHPSRVLILGYEGTGGNLPELIRQDRFAVAPSEQSDATSVELKLLPLTRLAFVRSGKWPEDDNLTKEQSRTVNRQIRALMNRYGCEAAVCFPPGFFKELESYPGRFRDHARKASKKPPPAVPRPLLVYDDSSDKKVLAHARVDRALTDWSAQVGQQSLAASNLSQWAARPIEFSRFDLAEEDQRINVSLWSKILPFVLLIWAVTGAFYPAIDLCAGEKERGTLETLLTSPARRGEIVLGKLLTVMLFSITTAILNLVAMAITGRVVMSQLKDLAAQADVGPPPLAALFYLALILIPIAALFSAVCLALAAFARSTKEGQYYLMPVILVTLPLILLPMAPSAELDLGFSLIPISGIVLLMRSVMEGTIGELWPYAFPVLGVTFFCCYLAIRWAVDQFRSEDVLFREGEKWDLGSWLVQSVRYRRPMPTAQIAVLCGVLILVVKFFLEATIDLPTTPSGIAALSLAKFSWKAILLPMLTILGITLAMTFLFTGEPRQTLALRRPPALSLFAAAMLAICLYPTATMLQMLVSQTYAIPQQMQAMLEAVEMKLASGPGWVALILIALVPAVCEELAFRGFILTGMRQPTGGQRDRRWRAIGVSSLFFALAHGILQQQISAFFLGLVLGYIAYQAQSVWPAILYHLTHNTTACLAHASGGLKWLEDQHYLAAGLLLGGLLLGVIVLLYFARLGRQRSRALRLDPPALGSKPA